MNETYKKWLEDGCPKVYCSCGCNQEIIITNLHKHNGIPKYIPHHHPSGRKGKPSWNKGLITTIHETYKKWLDNNCPKVICGCGCGIEIVIKIHHRYYGIPKYIYKHQNKSIESRKKLSKLREGKIPWNKGIHPGNHSSSEFKKGHKPTHGFKKGQMPKNSGYGKGFWYNSSLQGQIYLRSTYELAYAKYLDEHKILYLYENYTYPLGDTTYTPDFFLPQFEKFVEIKGWMRKEAQNKIDKFRELYPWKLEVLFKEDLIKLGIKLK